MLTGQTPNPNFFLRRLARAKTAAAAFLVSLAVAGCETGGTPLVREGVSTSPTESSRVLLMQPDVELSEVTAGGLEEPNAAWTEAARNNIEQALDSFFTKKGVQLASYGTAVSRPQEVQLVKLHEAVGTTILFHQYISAAALPSKSEFDWSLGDGAAVLGRNHGADYALFLHFRDSFASDGRVAFIVAAAIFGVGVPGGLQSGFASLVDLRTGDIVWFHRLLRTTGDLREPDEAQNAVGLLLTGLPL